MKSLLISTVVLDELEQRALLVVLGDLVELLLDVGGGAADHAHRHEQVVRLQEPRGQVLDVFGERRGEHQRLAVLVHAQ